MNIIVLDFETYYDAEYTLKKLSTSEYIRDHRYETIGCAVYSPIRALEVLGGKDRAFLRHHEFKKFCERTDWSQTCVLAHHAHFDGLILSYHYGCRPLFWLDSLSMARAVVGVSVGGSLEKLLDHYQVGKKGEEVKKVGGKHAKDFTDEEFARYAEYSVNDAVGAWNVFCMLMEEYPWGFPQSELRLIDMTVRMFTEPTLMLNEPLMLAYMDQEAKRKLALLDRAIQGVYGGEDKQVMLALAGQEVSSATMKAQLMSNDKFAELLKSVGVDPPQKWSEKKQRMDWAFAKSDPGFQALKDHPSELVQTLAEARLSTKSTINETRSRRIYNAGKFSQTLPVYLTYAGAHTFRWSGGDKTNYQNLERTSKDDPSKGAIRKAIVAPPGYKLVVADSAQIEARVLAWLAEQIDLVEAFAGGRDVYSEFASSIYGRKVDRKANKADFIPGFVGKVCIAEGELVLTDNGMKPIETVLASDKVWDGLEWVSHDGVVYNGVREVITYDGLTATPDHVVYTKCGAVEFRLAASNCWRLRTPTFGDNTRGYRSSAKVFDIVNAGPRHRFTVSGCLVSNCVLGLGYGMGFAKLAQQLAVGMLGGPPVVFTKDDANNMGVNVNAFASYEPFAKRVEEMASRIPLAERMIHSAVCHQVVQRYRDRNKSVVQFWRGCEDIIDLMVKTPYGKAHPIGPMEIVRQGLKLPSGMLMKYPNLRNRKDDADVKLMEAIAGEDAYQGRPEWVYQSREGHTRLYGGLLTENIVQALSRVIISDQMLAARDAGHRIVTMTHDEIVTIAPEAEAEQRYKELIQIMRTTPSWAKGLPLNAEGGYGDAYGDIK